MLNKCVSSFRSNTLLIPKLDQFMVFNLVKIKGKDKAIDARLPNADYFYVEKD